MQHNVHMCGELAGRDEKTLQVAFDGNANILATAERLDKIDKVASMVEKFGGLNRIQQLQHHKIELIYEKALHIIETFFPDGDQKTLFL